MTGKIKFKYRGPLYFNNEIHKQRKCGLPYKNVGGFTEIFSNLALLVASKEIWLQVNAEKTQNMVMSRDQSAGRSHTMKNADSSFEMVEEFKHLGTTLTLTLWP